jgi:hypothetical protein
MLMSPSRSSSKNWIGILLILIVFSLLAASCASHSPAKGPQPSPRGAALADVLEAVFRYQIGQNSAASSRYCLELAGTSPDASLLRRFEGNQPPVLSVDQCKSQPGPSLYLRLTKIQWVVDDEAWVRGAISDGSPTSPIVAYRVVRKKGTWTVEAAKKHGL